MGMIYVNVKNVSGVDTIVVSGWECNSTTGDIKVGPLNWFSSINFILRASDYYFPEQPIALRTSGFIGKCDMNSRDWKWDTPLKGQSKTGFSLSFPMINGEPREEFYALKVYKLGSSTPIYLDPKIRNGQPPLMVRLAAGVVVLAVVAFGVWKMFGTA